MNMNYRTSKRIGRNLRSVNIMPGRFLVIGILLFVAGASSLFAQGTGCYIGRWGIDAGLYSGVIEFGAGVEPVTPPRSRDWFQGAAGEGTINELNAVSLQSLLQGPGNPTYEERMKFGLVSIQAGQILIDGLYARDQFGGTGFTDPTSYNTASKNGEDPAIWDPGEANVLGKNDIIDVGGHMYRDGLTLGSDLWFVGLFNMAEPGGVSYMDFEFYVKSVNLLSGPGGISFTSGGPQLGHTAYTFDGPGNITKIGDFIFSVSLLSGGPSVETRLWVSRADWERLGGASMGSTPTFQWAGTYDGAFNNAPFGYAGILPLGPSQFCGYVNQTGQLPLAPPWGTKGTKTNAWGTNYIANSIAEVGINLTAFGMDHASLSGADPCFFPLNTFIVKTRASASFTAQLKDFAGPYAWGVFSADAIADPEPISCDNPFPSVEAFPQRTDLTYLWSTLDGEYIDILPYAGNESAKGFLVAPDDPCLLDPDPIGFPCNFLGAIDGDPWEVQVSKAGTYDVTIILPTNCPVQSASATVVPDPTKPFFDGPPTYSFTVPCNVNDGTITVTASGATQPYTFFLYNSDTDVLITSAAKNIGESTHTFTGLTSGNYRVDVKGVFACIVTTGPFTIPDRIPVNITESIVNLDCFGDNDGSITLTVTGGNPPLSYLWSTGNTSQNLQNLTAGTYTITVTDSDACTTTAQYSVTQPTQIQATIIKVDDPGNAGDGSAEVNPSGGTPGYTYLWSKTGDPGYVFTPSNSAQEVTDLSYGAYTVIVTDDNGCTRSFATFIFEKEICDDGIDNDGDGLTDCDDPECTPDTPGAISASNNAPCVDPDGMAPYAFTYTYTVPVNMDYDSYEWSVPVNAVIISGQGTEEIEVAWLTTAGGQICVRGEIFDCLSAPTCTTVNVTTVPPSATGIQID
jgi:hypothetical protein